MLSRAQLLHCLSCSTPQFTRDGCLSSKGEKAACTHPQLKCADTMKQLLPKLLYCSFILVHGLGFCSQAQGVSQIHHLLPPETRWNERIPGEKKQVLEK